MSIAFNEQIFLSTLSLTDVHTALKSRKQLRGEPTRHWLKLRNYTVQDKMDGVPARVDNE